MSTGAFPKQVKLSLRTAAWIESEVEAFMTARIAERDRPEPTPEDSPHLRMGEVMRLTGMTRAMIYDGVRAKTFPSEQTYQSAAQVGSRRILRRGKRHFLELVMSV